MKIITIKIAILLVIFKPLTSLECYVCENKSCEQQSKVLTTCESLTTTESTPGEIETESSTTGMPTPTTPLEYTTDLESSEIPDDIFQITRRKRQSGSVDWVCYTIKEGNDITKKGCMSDSEECKDNCSFCKTNKCNSSVTIMISNVLTVVSLGLLKFFYM